MSYDEHQAMWPQMIAALAAIDEAIGLPADGRNSIAQTLYRIRNMRAAEDKCNGYIVDNARISAENKKLRHLLFVAHGSSEHYLYGDDGERTCNTCMVDFNRDSAEEIERKIHDYNMRKFAQFCVLIHQRHGKEIAMTVAELVAYLQTQPQDMQVAYECCSELVLLEDRNIKHVEACEARPDGWIQRKRPDMPTRPYLVFPGN